MPAVVVAVKPIEGQQQQPLIDHDDEACFDKNFSQKRKASSVFSTEECPASPEPSIVSECEYNNNSLPPANKRRKSSSTASRRISFALDDANQIKASLKTFEKDYSEEDTEELWWSQGDLKQIMKREGRLVLSINRETSSSPSSPSADTSKALKHSINETFKQCASSSASSSEMSLYDEHNDHTTTTRGLERYLAPIMGAHSKMSIKSLLDAQDELAHCDPSTREEVLRARYQHLSKISSNFAIVLGECDAQIAAKL